MPLKAINRSEKNWESRVLPCPDGLAQIVCLPDWFWSTLDMLEGEHGVDRQLFIDDCFWDASRRQGDFAYAFVSSLEYAILTMYHYLIEKPQLGIANDNLERHDSWRTFRKEFFA